MLMDTDSAIRNDAAQPRLDIFRCQRCGDLGVWLTPQHRIEVCPIIRLNQPHAEPSPAAELVARAGRSLAFRNIDVSQLHFDVVRGLTGFTTTNPASRQMLINKYFGWSANQALRKFHNVIEEFRSVWLLPVASRKQSPSGYWISTDQADFAEYVERSAAAPRTQLSTIFRVAKANWPVYAEQLEMDFWRDIDPQSPVTA